MVAQSRIIGNDAHRDEGGLGRRSAVPHFRWGLEQDVSIGHALVAGTQRLKSAGLDTPRLDSEVLLGHVLGRDRAQLYAHSDRVLSDGERQRFEDLVERRFQHEPVAYLVGMKAFYGLDLLVDRRVLIPRPETELLVDLALDYVAQPEFLRSIAGNGNGHGAWDSAHAAIIADVGTGSGAVGLAIAANAPNVRIYALDVSPDALAVAEANARSHGLSGRIRFLQSNLLESLPEPVDLVVANLPYIAQDEWGDLSPDIAQHEPSLALAGGMDGLDLIRELLDQAPARLRAHGSVLLEIGSRQGARAANLARQHFPDALVEILTDYGYRDRILRIAT